MPSNKVRIKIRLKVKPKPSFNPSSLNRKRFLIAVVGSLGLVFLSTLLVKFNRSEGVNCTSEQLTEVAKRVPITASLVSNLTQISLGETIEGALSKVGNRNLYAYTTDKSPNIVVKVVPEGGLSALGIIVQSPPYNNFVGDAAFICEPQGAVSLRVASSYLPAGSYTISVRSYQ